MNYYGISEYYSPIPEIDHWLRRRVRMCYWKQWRLARTKVRNLLKLLLKDHGVEANLEYDDYLKSLKSLRKVW
ncbi:hypothetical protein BMS3Bbin06_00551 [bacterium BMS3Bbin06]|nr:hypothetical protein BMS3Abin08_02264 [bacterium BMS3Abin08]GBE34035.1 hypothetical protein BMS3Bbin06_00551 [bacterium BMS3Bbin06]HDZ61770.1 hypothetical protein [Nitrospirota bacterium]